MESLLLLLCLALPLFLFFFFQKHRATTRPHGPRGLPIIGNLHQLHNPTLHLQLWKFSKKYGPMFSLQLGLRPCLVVSSSTMAQEVLKIHDLHFCGRPSFLSQKKLFYNRVEIAFSPYNDSWREIKKICTVHVFSLNRVSSFSSIRQFEINQVIRKISLQASSSKVTNLSEVVMSLTNTIICRVSFGRSCEEEGRTKSRFLNLLNESQVLLGTFFVSDYIPLMGWIDKLRGLHARLERNSKEMDAFLQEVVNQHLDKKSDEEDIIDVLLKLKKQNSFSFDLTYDRIKAVLLDMLVGGTYTSAATVISAMTKLIGNPKAMMKVQAEVRNSFGNRGFVDEDEIQKLGYLKAVIKETLRLFPPVPLLLARETNEECIIKGYKIQAKTLVYVNAWAIQRDPEIWKDPEKFYPERFLESSIDFKGQDFELIPFGSGRRICPGLHFGVANVEIILANLLYWFDWEMPTEIEKEVTNSQMQPGIVQIEKDSLFLVPKKMDVLIFFT
ncbi:cytochrome P450 71A1-like [Gastrolobium bilobum]|uniref:cytochrome P450 71A1-like n=1 Tax=Gastrolobium bilobum TaxID=150636 RepID=UPI002AB1EC4E|nr:cytochrome P450 71A1-like [Gastrolobium bilobum]